MSPVGYTGEVTTSQPGVALSRGGGRSGASDILLMKVRPDGEISWVHGLGGGGAGAGQLGVGTALTVDIESWIGASGRAHVRREF